MPQMRFVLAAFLAVNAAAQVYVVDAGGGGSFTDLPAAIAGVPDGATLRVNAGSYSEFRIQGKSLTIIGAHTALVRIRGTFQGSSVTGLAVGQAVHISGMTLEGGQGLFSGSSLSCTACAGSIVLDGIDTTNVMTIRIDHCSDVHLTRCQIADPVVAPSGCVQVTASNLEVSFTTISGLLRVVPGNGYPALALDSSSFAVVHTSTLAGSWGAASVFGQGGSSGAPGALVRGGSTLHLVRSSLLGGEPGTGSPTLPPPKGGNGLVLIGASKARAFSTPLVGAAGEPGSSVDSTSTLEVRSNVGVMANFGALTPGAPLPLTLTGVPGSFAILMLGTATKFDPRFPVTLGGLFVQPLAYDTGLTIPPGGTLAYSLPVPATHPGNSIVFAQFAIFDPTRSEIYGSNTLCLVTR